MDGITVDRLTRTLARVGTRRAALGTVLAGADLGPSRERQVVAQPSCATRPLASAARTAPNADRAAATATY